MKKTISIILLSALCLSLFGFGIFADETPANPFSDVPDGAWYTEAALYCRNNGYIFGVSDDIFAPKSRLTRAMFATVIWKIEGAEKCDENAFTDVPENSWYKNAANWACKNSITAGTDEGIFSPNAEVSREQVALIMMKYAGFKGYDVSERADISGYKDSARVSSWALDGVKWAIYSGIISGKSADILDPRGGTTRAEAAQIVYKFMNAEHDVTITGLLEKHHLNVKTVEARIEKTDDPKNDKYVFAVWIDKTENFEWEIPEIKMTAKVFGNEKPADITLERKTENYYSSNEVSLKDVMTPDEILTARITFKIGNESETVMFHPQVVVSNYTLD